MFQMILPVYVLFTESDNCPATIELFPAIDEAIKEACEAIASFVERDHPDDEDTQKIADEFFQLYDSREYGLAYTYTKASCEFEYEGSNLEFLDQDLNIYVETQNVTFDHVRSTLREDREGSEPCLCGEPTCATCGKCHDADCAQYVAPALACHLGPILATPTQLDEQQEAIREAVRSLANAAETMHTGITQNNPEIAKLGASAAESAMRQMKEATR